MSSRKSSQAFDLTARQNPQFKQTTQKYLTQRRQRKQLDKRKTILSNQVKHFKKMNESLEKSLEEKKYELKWLKQVRERYMTDMQNKKDKDDQNKRKLQELRIHNTTMRQKSIQNIHDALAQLQRKKSRAHNQVVKTLNHLKKQYSQKKAIRDQANHSMYEQMRKSRINGKNHVNKFFRKRNTELTRAYKSLLNKQQQNFISSVKQIEELHTKQSRYKNKINKKQLKMKQLLKEIQDLKKSSHQIAMNIFKESRISSNKKVTKTQRAEIIDLPKLLEENSYHNILNKLSSN